MNEPVKKRPAPKGKVRYDRLLCGLLAALILLFTLLQFVVPDREFSEKENRTLAQTPALSGSALADGSYAAGVDDWFADQFVGRDGWLSFRLWLDTLRGSQESGGVFLGKDDYLLEQPQTPTEALPETLAAMEDFAYRNPLVPMNMMLIPCAAATMPEKLPDHAPVRDQLADIQAVGEKLQGSVALLKPAFDPEEGEIYYRTDHHWTSLGAYQAFRSIAPALELNTNAASWTAHPVSHSFQGTLASKSGKTGVTDTVTVYEAAPESPYYVFYPETQEKTGTMYRADCLENKDQYTVFFGGNYPLVELHTTASNGRKLLLFKDSYANCFVQFLTPYYETIVMVDPRYCYDSAQSLMTEYGITEVLFLYSANTFFADSTLADILNAK